MKSLITKGSGGTRMPNSYLPKPTVTRQEPRPLTSVAFFGSSEANMQSLPHTHSCFVCGESNASGLKLRFETDGRIVRTQFHPEKEHVGFKGVVHGGIIATVLDEVMVWACAVQTRQFAFCAEMNVRYLQPIVPGVEVIFAAELVTNRKNRIYEAKGSAKTIAGVTLAESTGKYIPLKSDHIPAMMDELIGDRSWLKANLGVNACENDATK